MTKVRRAMRSDTFIVEHGAYKLTVACPSCGATDGWTCYPGSWPKCWRCGVKVMSYGKTPDAPCVSPNGRIDGHMSYVRGIGGETACAFCGEKMSDAKRA